MARASRESRDFRRTLRSQIRQLANPASDAPGTTSLVYNGQTEEDGGQIDDSAKPRIEAEEEEKEVADICAAAAAIPGGDERRQRKRLSASSSASGGSSSNGAIFFIGEEQEAGKNDITSRASSRSPVIVMSTASSSTTTQDSGNGGSLLNSANTSASVSPIPPSYAPLLKPNQPHHQQQQQGLTVKTPMGPPTGSTLQLDKMRNFNKNLRRARSFRGSRECLRSPQLYNGNGSNSPRSRTNSSCSSSNGSDHGKASARLSPGREVTFAVRKTRYGRKGWKVMPEEDNLDLRCAEGAALVDRVMCVVRDIEYGGRAVPDKITVTVE